MDDPLPIVAGKVNAFLDKANKMEEYRRSAGALLHEAQRRVQAGEDGDMAWSEWCRLNIKRSFTDVQKLMRLGTLRFRPQRLSGKAVNSVASIMDMIRALPPPDLAKLEISLRRHLGG